MKDYIKPTFILAGFTPTALSTVACNIPKDELENLKGIIGVDPKDKTVFTEAEQCADPYDVGFFCKFTSTEEGFYKILGS